MLSFADLCGIEARLRCLIDPGLTATGEMLRIIASEHIPVDSAYLATYDSTTRSFYFGYNFDKGVVEEDTPPIPIGQGPTSQVVLTNSSFVLTSANCHIHTSATSFGEMNEVSNSAIHAPIRSHHFGDEGKVIAVFAVFSYQYEAYDTKAVEFVQWLCERISTQLFENLRQTQFQTEQSNHQSERDKLAQQLDDHAAGYQAVLSTITKDTDALLKSLSQADMSNDLRRRLLQLRMFCYKTQIAIQNRTLTPMCCPTLVLSDFTSKEQKVLQSLLLCQSVKEMANELKISSNSIQFHLKNIYRKLGVDNRAQATLAAIKIITLDSSLT